MPEREASTRPKDAWTLMASESVFSIASDREKSPRVSARKTTSLAFVHAQRRPSGRPRRRAKVAACGGCVTSPTSVEWRDVSAPVE